ALPPGVGRLRRRHAHLGPAAGTRAPDHSDESHALDHGAAVQRVPRPAAGDGGLRRPRQPRERRVGVLGRRRRHALGRQHAPHRRPRAPLRRPRVQRLRRAVVGGRPLGVCVAVLRRPPGHQRSAARGEVQDTAV
ncbi:hypothetical protein FBU31_003979, partial [Coemansia sp. 'formosensis']